MATNHDTNMSRLSDAVTSALIPLLVIFILGVVLMFLIWHPIPQANHDFVIYILGTLSGVIAKGAVDGMSKRSQGAANDDAPAPAPAPPPPASEDKAA